MQSPVHPILNNFIDISPWKHLARLEILVPIELLSRNQSFYINNVIHMSVSNLYQPKI